MYAHIQLEWFYCINARLYIFHVYNSFVVTQNTCMLYVGTYIPELVGVDITFDTT